MIFLSWAVAAVVWPPWIISWPYIEGVRTVPHDDCYIQFIYSNKYMSIITVIQVCNHKITSLDVDIFLPKVAS